MAANTAPVFPLTPYIKTADLTAATACTTRGPIAHASMASSPCYAVALSDTTTYGLRVDRIQVQATSTSITAPTAAQTVLLWADDGTKGYVIDEFIVTLQTPSTTSPAFSIYKDYDKLVLPPGHTLWVSTTVTTTASTTALVATLYGGVI